MRKNVDMTIYSRHVLLYSMTSREALPAIYRFRSTSRGIHVWTRINVRVTVV